MHRGPVRQSRQMSHREWVVLESTLRQRLARPLPGPDAQRRFAPRPLRDEWAPDLEPDTARRAAVLLLIYPSDAGAVVPLTLRHSDLPQHAGQVSLPGGAIDPGESAQMAALREAHEELGVPPADVRVLGPLSTLWVLVSNFVVHPFVGLTDRPPIFRTDPREVDALVTARLADICDPARLQWRRRERDGHLIDYPYFDLGGHQVWGATAMILGEFACLFDEHHGPPGRLG
jgi:8-oxo-dGTP pyrophosphatase MutT (NUDIX family)